MLAYSMPLAPFQIERYFARHEFTAGYLLSASDCESWTLAEVLAFATPEFRQRWDQLPLCYTETPGHPELRSLIASLYQTIRPAGVLVAVPEELIFIAMQTLLAPGDHAIVLTPAYQSLHSVLEGTGRRVTRWPLRKAGTRWELDFESLEESIAPDTRLLVVNFPHNPTGFLPTRRQFEQLLSIARRHDLYLFSDEMHRMLEFDPAARLPSACDLYDKAITLSGLSKAYGLPGLRVGWLATQRENLLEAWLTLKDYTTICGSAPGELLAIIALHAREDILEHGLRIIRENLDLANRVFESHPGHFRWMPPEAGSVAFPEWSGESEIDVICDRAVTETGVMIVPGSMFSFPGNHFRVGLGRRNFPEALDRAVRFLLNDRPG